MIKEQFHYFNIQADESLKQTLDRAKAIHHTNTAVKQHI